MTFKENYGNTMLERDIKHSCSSASFFHPRRYLKTLAMDWNRRMRLVTMFVAKILANQQKNTLC